MTSSRCRLIGLLVLALWLVLLSAGGAAADPRDRVAPRLRERLGQLHQSEEIAVNVVLRDAALPGPAQQSARRLAIRSRQQALLDSLPAGRFVEGPRYRHINGLSLRASPEVIEAIARHPDTEYVYEDGRVYAALAQGVALVGADQAHAVGVTGTGVSVAVIDSGIDTNHPDLADDLVAEQCWCRGGPGPNGCCPNGADTQSGEGSAEDDEGHGTEVSGVITSGGGVSDMGVAPDAGIVAIKVLGANGSGSFSDIDLALDWLLDNRVALDLRVVNLSLSDGSEQNDALANPCSGSNTGNAIRDLRAVGVITFASSGNDGFDDGISFPACVPDAVSVGGVYDASLGTVSWCGATCNTIICSDTGVAADDFVCHSNSDEILDLVAPDWRTTTTKRGGGVVNFGGTSAASPYAAAMAALLFEQDPSRTPDDVQTLLMSNGPLVTNPENGLSFRRPDLGTLFETCGDGVPGVGEDCDDGNTLDGDCCSSTCSFELVGSSCDDGDSCTSPDACDGAGVCVPGGPLTCDDGDFCNGAESCDTAGGCQPGTPPVLDDGVACTADACDEVGDVITHTPDSGFCDDGLFCNGIEVCDPVMDCVPGAAPDPDDGVVCTVDSCDEVGNVLVHVQDDGACDDGLWCNGAETCDALLDCQAGVAPSLDDGVGCTLDSCDEVADASVHTPDDGICDDSDPCTAESCDALLGCVTDPQSLCPPAVPVSRPLGLGLVALALLLLGSAWLALPRRAQASSPRSRPR